MNQNATVTRKAAYIGTIAVLLIPLFWLGQPPAVTEDQGRRPGGLLSQVREREELAQASLGDIDPASESMRLVTLGMRGVAANILWSKAHDYKIREDWDNLAATLNQIAKLQPNFISIWEFQAHNLSYNISAEFDDYRHRYRWVTRGIRYLLEGSEYNRKHPRLLWSIGWFTGQKIGLADEKLQYRRLFRVDDEFHVDMRPVRLRAGIDMDSFEVLGPDRLPDNWLASRLWFKLGQDVILNGGGLRNDIQSITTYQGKDNITSYYGKSPLIYHSNVAMAPINYATALEEEAYFDLLLSAWQLASDEWDAFGNRQIPTTWGVNLRLNELEDLHTRNQEIVSDLEQYKPGLREEILQAKRSQLPDQMQSALSKSEEERTMMDWGNIEMSKKLLIVFPQEMVAHSGFPKAHRVKARAIAQQASDLELQADRIERYRSIVNYEYWKTRCDVEQLETTLRARRLVHEGEELLDATKLEEARTAFEEAFVIWGDIFKRYPNLMGDVTSEDVYRSTLSYERLLNQLDLPFPKDFPLMEMANAFRRAEGLKELDVAEDAGPAQGAPGTGAVFPGDGDGADASTNGVEKQTEDVQETSPSPTEKQPTDGQEKQTGERQGR